MRERERERERCAREECGEVKKIEKWGDGEGEVDGD